MKQRLIIIIVVLSVFILINTPVMGNLFQNKSKTNNNEILTENKEKQKYVLDKILKSYIENREMKNILDDFESDCGCETVSKIKGFWNFPTICTFLLPLVIFFMYMYAFTKEKFFWDLWQNLSVLGEKLDCWWTFQ